MTGAYVNHEDIRQLLSNLGKVELPDRRYIIWALEHVGRCIGLPFSVLHYRCKAPGPRSEVGIPMTSETLFALGEAVVANDFTRLRNTERLALVAGAFGWKPDAFMHQLKSTTSGLGRNETLSLDYEALPALTIRNLDSGPSVWMMLDSISRRSDGLYLFSGPAGSGRSTTLEMTVGSIRGDKTVTIIGPEPGSARLHAHQIVEMSPALKRSPPDFLVLSEILDAVSARFALEMAKHTVVLATIHGVSPMATVKRLALLAEGLPVDGVRGVFSQRLVGAATGHPRLRLPVCYFRSFQRGEANTIALEPLPEGHMDWFYADAEMKSRMGETTIENVCAEFGSEFTAYMAKQDAARASRAKTTVVREIVRNDLVPFGKLKFSAEWPIEEYSAPSRKDP